MRVIDRIFEYLKRKNLTPYKFEKQCEIANGYLKKQTKGKGTVGSEILEKIVTAYPDISLNWLIRGDSATNAPTGYPDTDVPGDHFSEEKKMYATSEHIIRLLQEKVTILENALADKEKIIRLLEAQRKQH